jgi:hypothetical protein
LLSIDAIRQRHKGDSRKAWLEIWNVISHNQHAVIDATGASRIFRLVLRASAFRQAAPRVVRLTARDSVLGRRKKEQSGYGVFPVLLQANGKVSREYLADSVAFLPADLEIDTGKSGARETLTKTLRYLRGEQHNGRRT